MARRDDMDLMQWADGELDGADRDEVARQVDGSADDRAKVEAIGQIGEVVRTRLELAADDADPRLAGMWATIERRIQANGAGEAQAAPVVPTVPAAAPASQDGGLLASLWHWLDRHRAPVLSGALAAGAVAVLFLVMRPTKVVETPGPERIVRVPPAAGDSMPVVSEPAQVEELTVNNGTGYILTIPGDTGENDTTVIWIEPNDDKSGGPI